MPLSIFVILSFNPNVVLTIPYTILFFQFLHFFLCIN
nr:MAG TPA: hypothetical protein [Caudoviricetes sp.]